VIEYGHISFKFFIDIAVCVDDIHIVGTSFPIHIKFIITIFLDVVDCDVGKILNLYTDGFCQTLPYQTCDKISDTIISSIVLYYLYTNALLPNNKLYLVMFLLVFRIVGVTMFLLTYQRKYLFFFPNLYEIITLVFLINSEHESKLILSGILLKLAQEYRIHYY
jgi:hypothetical protein